MCPCDSYLARGDSAIESPPSGHSLRKPRSRKESRAPASRRVDVIDVGGLHRISGERARKRLRQPVDYVLRLIPPNPHAEQAKHMAADRPQRITGFST
jgi:hypothetical protein